MQANTRNDHLLTGEACGCRACGEVFNGESGFEAHRYGSHQAGRQCMTVDEMTEAGFRQRPNGKWMLPERSGEGGV